jgi:hypothetical protein
MGICRTVRCDAPGNLWSSIVKTNTTGQAAQLGFAGTDVPAIIKNDFNSLLKPPTTVIATVVACRPEIFVNKGSKKSVTTYGLVTRP